MSHPNAGERYVTPWLVIDFYSLPSHASVSDETS
jgi:hypothetical protein